MRGCSELTITPIDWTVSIALLLTAVISRRLVLRCYWQPNLGHWETALAVTRAAKADMTAAHLGEAIIARRATGTLCAVVPGSAAQDVVAVVVNYRSGADGIGAWAMCVVVGHVAILAPFPNIAYHVADTVWADVAGGSEMVHRCWAGVR